MKGWLRGDAPAAAVEIASDRVTVVSLSHAAGNGAAVHGWASQPLPEGAVVPSLTSLNIANAGAVVEALRRAFERAGVRPKRAGLVIPDLAAKVSLVPFETVPSNQEDLAGLVNWQVRKAVPFRIEDAQMSFIPGAPHGDRGRTFVVTLARKDIIRQYEDVCGDAGAHAGIVDLASFNVINAVLASPRAQSMGDPSTGSGSGDWLLVNSTRESQTLAIMRGGTLVFYRNRAIDDEETLPDLVHQTAMYYEDRLQGSAFERVVLAGAASSSGADVRRALSERLKAPVASIEPREVAAFGGDVTAASSDALLAPLGLLVRERGGGAAL